jgi:serine/threonine protein kinase
MESPPTPHANKMLIDSIVGTLSVNVNGLPSYAFNSPDAESFYDKRRELTESDRFARKMDTLRMSCPLSKLEAEFDEVSLIATGSYGDVLKARNLIDGVIYAIKRVSVKHKKQFLKEAKILASLTDRSSQIHVPYHTAWFDDQEFCCLQLKLCSFSLEDVWMAGNGEREAVAVLKQICKALQYLHKIAGIAHLDVKPSNILSVGNNWKLCDFGLSVEKDQVFLEGYEEGDARYMPKDLLDDSYPMDFERLCSADIFSLGMTLLQLHSDEPLPTNGPEWHAIRNGERLLPGSNKIFKYIGAMIDPIKRPSIEKLCASLAI